METKLHGRKSDLFRLHHKWAPSSYFFVYILTNLKWHHCLNVIIFFNIFVYALILTAAVNKTKELFVFPVVHDANMTTIFFFFFFLMRKSPRKIYVGNVTILIWTGYVVDDNEQ